MGETIGSRIREARKEKGFTQEELAKKVEVSKNYIYLIESGRENPGKKAVRDIAKTLGVTDHWILDGISSKIPPENESAAYVDELLGPEENPVYDLIKAIMKTYTELSPDKQETVKSFAKDLITNMAKKGDRG